jgi:para-nitrobenzyl esterase
MAIDAQAPKPASVNWWGYRGASVDGWVLPEMPWRVYYEGKEAPVALVLGTNVQEITPEGQTLDELRHVMAETVGYKAASQLETLFSQSPDPLLGPPATRFATDHDFHCAVRLLAAWHASHGFPTWVYRFDRPDPGDASAIHTSELYYVFSFQHKVKPSPEDMEIAHAMHQYWTSFAKNAVPTGPAAWPQYQAKQFGPWLDIPKTGTALRADDTPFGGDACAIMDPAYPK